MRTLLLALVTRLLTMLKGLAVPTQTSKGATQVTVKTQTRSGIANLTMALTLLRLLAPVLTPAVSRLAGKYPALGRLLSMISDRYPVLSPLVGPLQAPAPVALQLPPTEPTVKPPTTGTQRSV